MSTRIIQIHKEVRRVLKRAAKEIRRLQKENKSLRNEIDGLVDRAVESDPVGNAEEEAFYQSLQNESQITDSGC